MLIISGCLSPEKRILLQSRQDTKIKKYMGSSQKELRKIMNFGRRKMFQLSLRATEGSVAISTTCHFETVPNFKRLEII